MLGANSVPVKVKAKALTSVTGSGRSQDLTEN